MMVKKGDIVESQMYWDGESFEIECPCCFSGCYIFSENDIVCKENPNKHKFSLAEAAIGS